MHWQRHFALSLLAAAMATAAGQLRTQGATAIPDFSGTWIHPFCCGFAPPKSGPGPVINKSRVRQLIGADGLPLPAGANAPLASDPRQFVGNHINPILKPAAAEILKKHGEMSLNGVTFPAPSNQCWPEGVPYIFAINAIQMIEQANNITILYDNDHQVRHVRLNEIHPARVTPSWYGDSVAHYEGNALVIDTIGIKIGPFSMIDRYGTPYSQALHVVERYRLIDDEAAKEAEERSATEILRTRFRASGATGLLADPSYKGRQLQLDFTVEDEGVFTMPWSATINYRRSFGEWPEHVCAENIRWSPGRDGAVPAADKPDF
jgi:hypothetical protein